MMSNKMSSHSTMKNRGGPDETESTSETRIVQLNKEYEMLIQTP